MLEALVQLGARPPSEHFNDDMTYYIHACIAVCTVRAAKHAIKVFNIINFPAKRLGIGRITTEHVIELINLAHVPIVQIRVQADCVLKHLTKGIDITSRPRGNILIQLCSTKDRVRKDRGGRRVPTKPIDSSKDDGTLRHKVECF
jgi:hypothetical protein